MKTQLPPSVALYRQARARLVERNITLSSIARDLGIERHNIRAAVTGTWDGPKGRMIREEVLRRAGLLAA